VEIYICRGYSGLPAGPAMFGRARRSAIPFSTPSGGVACRFRLPPKGLPKLAMGCPNPPLRKARETSPLSTGVTPKLSELNIGKLKLLSSWLRSSE